MANQVTCTRCETEMQFLQTYRFDSRHDQRGLLGSLFDIEQHLVLDVWVCPDCRKVEFFYGGEHTRFDR
ncbi:MAG TPA: hypothetical protein VK191_03020 [Symbiobacteriaceae bacterium]|nr:hypothetical protein [Symbiobacteriaceae bacterium]